MPMIEVSCPSVSDMGMNIKNYSFIGEGHCTQCGEKIDVSLTVANRIKKEEIPKWNL